MDIEYYGVSKAVVRFDKNLMNNINDVFLNIDYIGDIGNTFIENKLISDDFCNNTIWKIGLKRFMPEMQEKGLLLNIIPIKKGTMVVKNVAIAYEAEFEGDLIARINKITAIPEYKVIIGKKSNL